MKNKRVVALLLCLSLFCAVFCSCKRQETTQPEQTTVAAEQTGNKTADEPKTAVIGYYSSDSLDPYKTKSRTNLAAAMLLYDSLFKLNSEFEPVASIAESIEIEEKKVTVTIKEGLSFSNGEEITASDVAYSFVLAKSSPMYSASLSNIASCTDSAGFVVFTLYVKDSYVASCLDFPIVQKGTLKKGLPVGSGRYTAKKTDGEYVFVASQSSTSEEIMAQQELKLLDIGTIENCIYLLRTSELSCYYDAEGEKSNLKTDSSVSKVTLNNLVFLGINSESDIFSSQQARQALMALVDKDEISDSAYDSMAKSAFCVFNPDWEKCSALKEQSTTADSAEAALLLDKAGFYHRKANDRRLLTAEGNLALVRLVVNEEDERRVRAAKLVASRLEKAGFTVETKVLSFENYEAVLAEGEFELYLGEVKIGGNMDLSPFFSSAGKVNYGIDLESPLCDAYFDFKEGKIDISTFESVFRQEVCFVPLCYRRSAVYYSRSLTFEGSPTQSDIYENIYSWGFVNN